MINIEVNDVEKTKQEFDMKIMTLLVEIMIHRHLSYGLIRRQTKTILTIDTWNFLSSYTCLRRIVSQYTYTLDLHI